MDVKTKAKTWTWRPPRVRFEPPTIEEAMSAARGMSGDHDQQVEIAAGLIGLPVEAVRQQYPASPVTARGTRASRSSVGGGRTVIVERKARRSSSASSVR